MTKTNRRPAKRGSSASSLGRQRAAEVVRFFDHALYHGKGRQAGHPFTLAGWQRRDIIEPLFGGLRPDGRRQYRTCFVEIGRKNGKSSLAAGVALVLLFLDNEPGAEILCLASDVDQARVVFGECKRLVESSPEIQQAFAPTMYRDAIEYGETGSVLKVMSADEKGIHGRNPHGLVMDEVHTLTTPRQREFFAGAMTAQGARSNPVALLITTAGESREGPAWDLHRYAAEIRAGLRSDPSFLSVYYGLPEGSDWKSSNLWSQANPAMVGKDAFLSLEYLQSEFRQAEAMPAKEAAFRRLYLNQWPEQADNAFIDLQTFDTSAGHPTRESELKSRQAYGGLDVAAVSDLTPLVWVVPCRHTEGAWDVFVRVFLPEAALQHSRNADLYRSWRDAGWLTLTPGDVIDYRRVTDAILADARQLDIRRLTIDAKFQGVQIAQTLADQGVPVMEMPQTHTAFAAPMKELERLLKSGMLHHGANPILRWCMANMVVKADHDGGLKPDKRRSHEKIDAVVALTMALDGVIRQPLETGSVYDTRGVEFV